MSLDSSHRGDFSADSLPADAHAERLTFNGDNSFHRELRRRVDAEFKRSGTSQRDSAQMYLKTAVILATFALAYAALVFFAATWWQALPLALVLGTAMAGIGFNIMHDGGHQAYSERRWINRLMALALDL
ncbi:MAG: fatty acid desaturase, partial [Pseudomonadota bacterium]